MEWDSAFLDALIERLLGRLDAAECRGLADAHPDVLRSDELDGRLALRASQVRSHPEHLDRIGAIRHCLELARFNGFAETPQPVSHWFQWLFEPGGPFTRDPPAPIEPEPSELPADMRLYGDLALALILARSWEERRRLLVAHASHAEQLEGMLDGMAAMPEWSRVAASLANVVRDGRRRGWSVACADGPNLFPVESAGVNIEGSFLTIDEQLQLVWLAYLEAPAWHQRRAIVLRSGDLLLAPAHGDQLNDLWRQAELALSKDMVSRARDVLDRARQAGVEEAFSHELPATKVVMAGAARALATATGAAKVAALRTLVHFYNPSLWATMHAQLCDLLAGALLEAGEASGATAIEEASWRAKEAAVDLVGLDVGSDGQARAIHTTLAQIQLQRVRGPRDRHVEAAIEILERIVESVPDKVSAAGLHLDLAGCYLLRISGAEYENAVRAYEHAAIALSSATESGDTELLAHAHTRLGAAIHTMLPRGESVNRSEAVGHLKRALALSKDLGTSAAMAHQHLGAVFASSGPGSHAEAMHHFGAALAFYTRERNPLRWAEIHEALGNALMRGRPDDPGAWEDARSHYRLALEEYEGSPGLLLRCMVSLATTHFRADDWQSALDLYREVLDLAEDMGAYEATEAGRLGLVSALRTVHERAAYSLTQLGDPWEALTTLERGRITELRRLYQGSFGRGMEEQNLAQLVRAAVRDSPIVLPLITSAASLCFVLIDSEDGPALHQVPLPGLTDMDLRLLFDGGPDRRGWFFAYHDLLQAESSEDLASDDDLVRARAQGSLEEAFDLWSAEIWLALADLGRLLMSPVAAFLRSIGVAEGSQVRIVPSKWLNLVPLHAAPDQDGRPFMDSFHLTTLPALWLLDGADAPTETREPMLVSLVADEQELRFAKDEARAVARHFRDSMLLRADWEGVTALVGLLDRATHLHIVCHGSYDWSRPQESGLVLSDGSVLTAETIGHFPLAATELVTLSACETGLTESDRAPGELLGLSGSLLAAGARTVVCSLWVVDDEVTEQFMAAFYSGLQLDGETARALASAQKALRAAGYDNPFYWAAFNLIDAR